MKAFFPSFLGKKKKKKDVGCSIISQSKKLGEFIKGQRTVGLEIINSKPEAGKTQMSLSV